MTADDFTPQFGGPPDPHADAAKQAIDARDWAAFRQYFDAATHWRPRLIMMSTGEAVDGAQEFLHSVIRRDPEDLVATTMYASTIVDAGWNIRTGKRAKDVSRAQFEAFHEHLRRAEQILIWVCARNPAFVPAWNTRLNIARGLSLGHSEARRRYDHAVKHYPHNFYAQGSMQQILCPKWGGDFATMHAFSRQCAQEAPPGYPNGVLVVIGHLEHWAELDDDEADAYFKDEAVRQDIRAAAERSVLHPELNRNLNWVAALSGFAAAFTMMGDWTMAKRCFLALGPYADSWGWNYLSSRVTETFLKYRAIALEHG